MGFIWTCIRLVIIGIFALVYYPINMFFLWLQGHYRGWQKTDRVSFWIATPLYYLLFIVTAILSIPIEKLGDDAHPNLPGFR